MEVATRVQQAAGACVGHLLFSFIGSLLESAYQSLRLRIRQLQLIRYAKLHGYSFSAKNADNGIAFSLNAFSLSPSKDYRVDRATNVIRGSIDGLPFIYFEKVLLEVGEDSAEKPVASRSLVSVGHPADKYFAAEIAFDKELPFYREEGGICFWWNDASVEAKAVPVKKLDQWLAEIRSTFKSLSSEHALASERA
jgi:hypothetical protein